MIAVIVWFTCGFIALAGFGYDFYKSEGKITVGELPQAFLILFFGPMSLLGAIVFKLGALYEKYENVVIFEREDD
jgi:hypothetical protein